MNTERALSIDDQQNNLIDTIDLFGRVCHALGSSETSQETSQLAIRFAREALGEADQIALYLFQEEELVKAESIRSDLTDPRSLEQAKRSFETKSPLRGSAGRPAATLDLVAFPLVSRGEVFGAMTAIAETEVLNRAWPVLEGIVSQAAIALRHIHERASHSGQENSKLLRDLLESRNRDESVKFALDNVYKQSRLPVAAWVETPSRRGMIFKGCRGMGSAKRSALLKSMRKLPALRNLSEEEIERQTKRFARIVGTASASLIDADDVVFIVAGASSSAISKLEGLTAVLRHAITHRDVASLAEQHRNQMNFGIAAAAHELRRPITGVKAAIEKYLQDATTATVAHEPLHRSHEELQELSVLVEGLLRWAVGSNTLDRQLTDLNSVVREAVRSNALGEDEGRIRFSKTSPVLVEADLAHLKTAISNLVRNALDFSPPESKVDVEVDQQGDLASIRVLDRGPGIDPADSVAIFHPLVTSRQSSGGSGLGLFLAQRIVEQHEGRIWFESKGNGTIFHIDLPLYKDGAARSES